MIKTILHLSDTHGQHRSLVGLPDADLLVHSGDITMGGSETEAIDFIEWLCDLPYRHKVFIAGNHDDCLRSAEIDGLPDNCHYLDNSGVTVDGLNIYGVSMFVTDTMTEKYQKSIQAIPEHTDILITHQPPLGILDSSQGIHYGNRTLCKRVCIISPKLHLFGHIHDAYGKLEINGTVYVNSAVVDENYRLQHPHQLLSIPPKGLV